MSIQKYSYMLNKIQILRALLLGAGLGWGLTVVGAILPWDFAIEHLEKFGGSGPIPNDPMMNYWLRMASGAFGIIGMLFILSAIYPYKYTNIIPFLGYASIFEGIILVAYGILLKLSWFPFIVDIAIAFIPGIGILFLKSELTKSPST